MIYLVTSTTVELTQALELNAEGTILSGTFLPVGSLISAGTYLPVATFINGTLYPAQTLLDTDIALTSSLTLTSNIINAPLFKFGSGTILVINQVFSSSSEPQYQGGIIMQQQTINYEDVFEAVNSWSYAYPNPLKEPGPEGPQGKPGVPGPPGQPGQETTLRTLICALDNVFKEINCGTREAIQAVKEAKDLEIELVKEQCCDRRDPCHKSICSKFESDVRVCDRFEHYNFHQSLLIKKLEYAKKTEFLLIEANNNRSNQLLIEHSRLKHLKSLKCCNSYEISKIERKIELLTHRIEKDENEIHKLREFIDEVEKSTDDVEHNIDRLRECF